MENDQREEIPQTVRPAAPGINPVGKVIA
jgi:hypothetical protein